MRPAAFPDESDSCDGRADACRSGKLAWFLLAITCLASARDMGSAQWPGDLLGRVEALAVLQTLNAELLSHDSATMTLEHWCSLHHLADAPTIVAERVAVAEIPPTPEQRRELGVSDDEPVRHRRVRLRCGDKVLSEADNWYVPARLTPEMNRQLDTTDTPFGKAARPLHFQRRTLEAMLLWRPLPEGWEHDAGIHPSGRLDLPQHLLRHKALLQLPDGTPISEVVETYTREVMAFPITAPVSAPTSPHRHPAR